MHDEDFFRYNRGVEGGVFLLSGMLKILLDPSWEICHYAFREDSIKRTNPSVVPYRNYGIDEQENSQSAVEQLGIRPSCFRSTRSLGRTQLIGKDQEQGGQLNDYICYQTSARPGEPRKADPCHGSIYELPPVDPARCALYLVDDSGAVFRKSEQLWLPFLEHLDKAAASGASLPTVIVKLRRPYEEEDSAGFLSELLKNHADRTVLIASAVELRAKGVGISKQLSWERTATDTVWQLSKNPSLEMYKKCKDFVLLFDLDGALHTRRHGTSASSSSLIYETKGTEGYWRSLMSGFVHGTNSYLVASLVCGLLGESPSEPAKSFKDHEGESQGKNAYALLNPALSSARAYHAHGYGQDIQTVSSFAKAVSPTENGDERETVWREYHGKIQELALKLESDDAPFPTPLQIMNVPAASLDKSDPEYWSILRQKLNSSRNRSVIDEAINFVVTGQESQAFLESPVGVFGLLRTYERQEIESYRSIQNLMRSYLGDSQRKKPLSLAVFGPPGGGKSFGVLEIAKSVYAQSDMEAETYNLSQITSLEDLVRIFHQIRDRSLSRQCPLIFFDEFDSALNGVPLFWLKYFLEPMQDGTFHDSNHEHPIGRAIFVFAGGTAKSYGDFIRQGEAQGVNPDGFRDAKGPDFASRLRGVVNLVGINMDDEMDPDLVLIRRAVLLRSMCMREGSPVPIKTKDIAMIDRAIVHAMLKVDRYYHGARSMEAVLQMCGASGKSGIEQAALPSAEQLDLHVDGQKLFDLVRDHSNVGVRQGS